MLTEFYADPANLDRGFLDRLAVQMNRSRAAVALRASRLGLGDYRRRLPEQFRKSPRKPKHATSEARADAIREGTRRYQAEHGHPRGYAGHKHSAETLAKISARVRAAWADPSSSFHTDEAKQRRSDAMSLNAATRARAQGGAVYSSARRGYRDDLGPIHFRSRWEANYARYLNLLQAQARIVEWQFECQTFWFEAIRRGVRSYTPDFRVQLPDGTHEWHEVKGWMDPKSATKLKRMKKYHPSEKVLVIREPFFLQAERSGLAGTIPCWEFKRAK